MKNYIASHLCKYLSVISLKKEMFLGLINTVFHSSVI